MARKAGKKAAKKAAKAVAEKNGSARAERHYEDILYEVKDQIAWVTINRERVRNAFREQTLDEMIDALKANARGSLHRLRGGDRQRRQGVLRGRRFLRHEAARPGPTATCGTTACRGSR